MTTASQETRMTAIATPKITAPTTTSSDLLRIRI